MTAFKGCVYLFMSIYRRNDKLSRFVVVEKSLLFSREMAGKRGEMLTNTFCVAIISKHKCNTLTAVADTQRYWTHNNNAAERTVMYFFCVNTRLFVQKSDRKKGGFLFG